MGGNQKPRVSESARIADQAQRAFQGEAWHGSALLELLKDVDAATAAARPINNAHSIWEIVNHLHAWICVIRRRINLEVVELEGEADWPPVKDSSAAAWQRTLQEWANAHTELEQAMAGLTDERLAAKVPNRPHDVWFTVHGFVQHDLYHAGQIAMLKKAALAPKAKTRQP